MHDELEDSFGHMQLDTNTTAHSVNELSEHEHEHELPVQQLPAAAPAACWTSLRVCLRVQRASLFLFLVPFAPGSLAVATGVTGAGLVQGVFPHAVVDGSAGMLKRWRRRWRGGGGWAQGAFGERVEVGRKGGERLDVTRWTATLLATSRFGSEACSSM